MKHVRKALTLVLALCLVLAFGATAFAETATTPTDTEKVTVTKVYKQVGTGNSPAETFTLQQVGNGTVTDGDASSAPALGTITGAAFAAGAATADGAEMGITIELPSYETVGVYEYTLQEVAGTTAGVTYYGNTIKLVVTVVNGDSGKLRIAAVHTESTGEEKDDSFENTYSSDTLTIKKTVTGNLGDKSKYFEFTVTLTGETGKTYADSYAVTGGSNINNPTTIAIGTAATFYLKDGETISIANLPYGVQWTVAEDDYADDGYTTTKTGDTGTIGTDTAVASFTNNKEGTPDTGISLDSIPYVLILAVVAVAAIASCAAIYRKRRSEDR